MWVMAQGCFTPAPLFSTWMVPTAGNSWQRQGVLVRQTARPQWTAITNYCETGEGMPVRQEVGEALVS